MTDNRIELRNIGPVATAGLKARLSRCGWQVVAADGDLILDGGGAGAADTGRSVPWLRFGAAPGGGDHDGVVRPDEDPCAALDGWRPAPLSDATLRLRTLFGDEALGQLLAGLRGQLADALSGGALPDGEPHRLVGIAGTLGFRALGEAWRGVMEDRAGALADARRLSRLAIAAIDRAAFVPRPSSPRP